MLGGNQDDYEEDVQNWWFKVAEAEKICRCIRASIDIRNSGIAVTGKGIFEPDGGFTPIVASTDMRFEIEFLSPHKRPVSVQYDGFAINSDLDNPIASIFIERDPDHSVSLLLRDDPSTRAFAAMMPQ